MESIPLLDLKAQFQTIQSRVEEVLLSVLHEQHFILGPEVQALEIEIADLIDVHHAIGVSSGSDALLMALLALNIGPGDEVITSPFSFFATAGSIARTGARPVFVDIDQDTFNLDPNKLTSRISTRTRAVLPVHLFGHCAAMDQIAAVAGDLPLIEDVAQAIGAERDGKKAGAIGVIGCFSFFPSKNLGGIGDGGMLTTNDPDLAKKLKALRVHGQLGLSRYQHDLLGGNFRLDAIQAAVLRVKLEYLERWTERRRANAKRYHELFDQAAVDITLPPTDENTSHRDVYNQFVIRVHRRDQLRDYLLSQQIGCAVYYPKGLHQQPCFSELGYRDGDFPICEEATRTSLALPIFPELEDWQICRVVEQIVSFMKK